MWKALPLKTFGLKMIQPGINLNQGREAPPSR